MNESRLVTLNDLYVYHAAREKARALPFPLARDHVSMYRMSLAKADKTVAGEHLMSAGHVHVGMSVSQFVKSVERNDAHPIGFFKSPDNGQTLLCARAADGLLIRARFVSELVGIETTQWIMMAEEHQALDFDYATHRRGLVRDIVLFSDILSNPVVHTSVSTWFSASRRSETAWSRGLFTRGEISSVLSAACPEERIAVGRERSDAIAAPWRDLLDLDMKRPHLYDPHVSKASEMKS